MVVHHAHIVPIVEDSRLVGVVGIRDILSSIADITANTGTTDP
jgi:CBS domain-containing protein